MSVAPLGGTKETHNPVRGLRHRSRRGTCPCASHARLIPASPSHPTNNNSDQDAQPRDFRVCRHGGRHRADRDPAPPAPPSGRQERAVCVRAIQGRAGAGVRGVPTGTLRGQESKSKGTPDPALLPTTLTHALASIFLSSHPTTGHRLLGHNERGLPTQIPDPGPQAEHREASDLGDAGRRRRGGVRVGLERRQTSRSSCRQLPASAKVGVELPGNTGSRSLPPPPP